MIGKLFALIRTKRTNAAVKVMYLSRFQNPLMIRPRAAGARAVLGVLAENPCVRYNVFSIPYKDNARSVPAENKTNR
ncbi:hypothetical protein DRQ36_03320 [bacterium]|nr:MAG: hypothetical protein DRQ36_03320 [bacterium]